MTNLTLETGTNEEKEEEKEKKVWTIMLYFSGDNNLSSEMIGAINDIGALALPSQGEEGKNIPALTIQYNPVSSDFPPSRYDFAPARKSFYDLRTQHVDGLAFPQEWAREREFVPEDSAAPETLSDFIVWSVRAHPSKYRMLVLSGHGSGAVGDFLPDAHPRLEQYVDRGRPGSDALTIPGLGRALRLAETELKSSGKLAPQDLLLHILGMDSCLMGMAEIAYQVQGFAEYLVASEGFVPNFGWPYGRMLTGYSERIKTALGGRPPDLTPVSVSSYIVRDYIRHYSDQGSANVSVDIASCELAVLGEECQPNEDLRTNLNGLTTILCRCLERVKTIDEIEDELSKEERDRMDKKREEEIQLRVQVDWKKQREEAQARTDKRREEEIQLRAQFEWICDLIVLAHWKAQSFNHEEYTDLWDFCTELKGACRCQRERLKENHDRLGDVSADCKRIEDACGKVAEKVEELIGGAKPRQSHWGPGCQHAHGLAVYFPWSDPGPEVFDHYSQLELGRGLHHPGWARFLKLYVDKTRREKRKKRVSEVQGAEAMGGQANADMNVAGKTTTPTDSAPAFGQKGRFRNSPGYNRNSPGYNRLLSLFDDQLPGGMKNPPVKWNPPDFTQSPPYKIGVVLRTEDRQRKNQQGEPLDGVVVDIATMPAPPPDA